MTNIPDWLCNDEHYEPKKDRASFIDKSTKSVMKVLSSVKGNNNKKAKKANTSLRLFGMLVAIILTSVSRNFSFTLFMIAFVIVRIALLNGDCIKSWLKTVIPVVLLSSLILLPSVFLGNPKTLITVVSKIFVCVSLVSIVNLTTAFNDITSALKRFHIPDVVIFTFDITIKYIIILSNICLDMLKALKIRSIGKNKEKDTSVSGILGNVFIKANEYADMTNKAMECRGFNGVYVIKKSAKRLSKYDLLLLVIYAIIALVFVYLEVLI